MLFYPDEGGRGGRSRSYIGGGWWRYGRCGAHVDDLLSLDHFQIRGHLCHTETQKYFMYFLDEKGDGADAVGG
jgi:hypothetical protein